jgi:hypothetical protein
MRKKDEDAREAVKAKLLEAEREYQRARTDDYLTRLVRDSAMVEAHRAGFSSREISELLGGIGQPNVVRARRRAEAQQKAFPKGLLSPTEAVRASGLDVKQFVRAVREGRITPVEPSPGVRAFRPEDLRDLARASSGR